MCEKRAGQLQDLVGLAQFAHFSLQLLDALLLGRLPTSHPHQRLSASRGTEAGTLGLTKLIGPLIT